MLILFLGANSVFGQTSPKAIAMEDKAFNGYFFNRVIPKVKGKILNLSKEEIKKTKVEYTIVTPLQKFQVTKHCSLNADGSFELKLDYAFPCQQIWIDIDGLFYTGVYANTDLLIQLDAAVLKKRPDAAYNGPGVKYKGRDGVLNEYTTKHILYKDDEQATVTSMMDASLRTDHNDYAAFIRKYDSLSKVLENIDNEYIQQNPSPFSWIFKNERASYYFAGLCFRHWDKPMPPELFEKVKAHKAYLTSNEGMSFYKYFLTYLENISMSKFAAYELSSDIDEANLQITDQTIGLLDSLFEPSKSDFFKIKFSSLDTKEQQQKMEMVLPDVKTLWCRNVIKSEYNITLKKIASINKTLNASIPIVSGHQLGQPVAELPFGAKLYTVTDMKAGNLLSKIKSSFKDKALLIDFWATWCGPCISELPYSKKLSDESKDLPVEFIYLCTSESSDMEKWKSKIVEYKLSGHHIFVEKGLNSALMNLLSLSGYPSYLLINKNGEYKADIISRPSKLNREKLFELLKK